MTKWRKPFHEAVWPERYVRILALFKGGRILAGQKAILRTMERAR